ncbi:type I-B CRISPR-associated protein Cas5b [Caldicellulosiruptoraceae bacterium PP1]
MKIILFDIWSDYGYFGKYYTTSSPLTFSFPPLPTIKGMIGAISGLDKNVYIDELNKLNFKASVKIINPIKKIRMGINLINTKDNFWIPVKKKSHEPRTQVNFEFLKNPYYRLYISCDEPFFTQLNNSIKNHNSYYTLSMGLSELIANFKYVGLFEAKEINSKLEVDIDSPINISHIDTTNRWLKIENDKSYIKEMLPTIMNSKREIEKYDFYLYEPKGQAIKCLAQKYWEVENGDNIIFF